MNPKIKHYQQLAELFYFPGDDYRERALEACEIIRELYPEAAKELNLFNEFIKECSIDDIQELYTRSFDVQSITTLDIGYVMFGDDYKRGALLVNLNREMAAAEIDCRNELSDNFANVLNLIWKMEDRVIGIELIEKIFLPALEKMCKEFDPARVGKKNKVYKKHHKTILETSVKYALVFREPLLALVKIIKADFEVEAWRTPRKSMDFLGAIAKEIDLEPLK